MKMQQISNVTIQPMHLVTGYDIIFFWVSRMIFQGIEFTGERPFKDVLIHGLSS